MSMKKPRGYLLLEAMIAGAVVAVTLLIALDFAAKSRADTSAAGQRQVASTLARAQTDTIISALPTATADQVAFAAVAGMPGLRMKWTTTTDAVLGTLSTPPIATPIKQVTVTVEYSVPIGSAEDLRAGAKDGKAEIVAHQTWVQ